MCAHFVSLKGDRSSNEDNHNIILALNDNNDDKAKVNYYGVYDGHGGKFVSKFLSNTIYHFFLDKKVNYPLEKKYVNRVFNKIQHTLFTRYEEKVTDCGSTCLIACHFKHSKTGKNWLNVINTGDSRCVICKNDIAIQLTSDHKPNRPTEFNRITKLGGKIRKDGNTYRINDLSVSRAFGDKESKKYITHVPEIYKHKLTEEDRFMIVACDGLWDVMESQEVVDFVLKNCYDLNMNRINHDDNISRKLAERSIELDSGDNVTCIVVFFD